MDHSGCHVTLGVSVLCELYTLCSGKLEPQEKAWKVAFPSPSFKLYPAEHGSLLSYPQS